MYAHSRCLVYVTGHKYTVMHHTHLHTHAHTYVCTYVCIHMCAYVRMCMCMYMYVCTSGLACCTGHILTCFTVLTHTCIHVHVHVRTYIRMCFTGHKCKIQVSGMLYWAKEQNEEKSPHLTAFTMHFNKVSQWTKTKLLDKTLDMRGRVKLILHFVSTMKVSQSVQEIVPQGYSYNNSLTSENLSGQH